MCIITYTYIVACELVQILGMKNVKNPVMLSQTSLMLSRSVHKSAVFTCKKAHGIIVCMNLGLTFDI